LRRLVYYRVSLHQNTNDDTCFKDHLDQASVHQPVMPENIIAYGIFGTEENYELLENKGINNYLKFAQFHNEQKKNHQNTPFLKENFCYDPAADSYTCPNKQQLTFRSSNVQGLSQNLLYSESNFLDKDRFLKKLCLF
jgi:hypothetical protein